MMEIQKQNDRGWGASYAKQNAAQSVKHVPFRFVGLNNDLNAGITFTCKGNLIMNKSNPSTTSIISSKFHITFLTPTFGIDFDHKRM